MIPSLPHTAASPHRNADDKVGVLPQDAVETVASAGNTLKWHIEDASESLSESVSDAVASAADNWEVRKAKSIDPCPAAHHQLTWRAAACGLLLSSDVL